MRQVAREMVEQVVDTVEQGVHRRRRATVNLAESPLSWLRARAMVDARQYAAGERLRRDYETASIAPGVTMRWDTTPRGSPGTGLDPTSAQVAAKARFHAAVEAAGPGLADIVWRVVCAGEGLPAAERGLGWPTRSGKLVLGLALDRLAEHYGLDREGGGDRATGPGDGGERRCFAAV